MILRKFVQKAMSIFLGEIFREKRKGENVDVMLKFFFRNRGKKWRIKCNHVDNLKILEFHSLYGILGTLRSDLFCDGDGNEHLHIWDTCIHYFGWKMLIVQM